jgi:F420-non-reducing hydrogenase small subunit
MPKLKLAIYWGAGCGGCDVSVLDLHERILDVAAAADLVFWPIALDTKLADVEALPDGHIDACLFNGAIRSSENEHVARLLRKKSKLLVAYGSCAHLGGIPGLANFDSVEALKKVVYQQTPSTVNPEGTVPTEKTAMPVGELDLPRLNARVAPLDEVVPVDYYVPGCPPALDQVQAVLGALIAGELPERGSVLGASSVALCEECKRRKSEKRVKAFRDLATFIPDPEVCFIDQGIVCCGPATRAGCGFQCSKANMPCRGCYGPPDGIADQGGKLVSAIASVIDSEDPAEIERIVDGLRDPAGTFYRFSLPSALTGGAQRKELS